MDNTLILYIFCFLFAAIAFISYRKYIKYFNLYDAESKKVNKLERYNRDQVNLRQKEINDLTKIINFFLHLHSETPAALVETDIKRSFEVKMSGGIIARCRLRSKGVGGTDKRIVKDGKLVYLMSKDGYVLVDDLKRLKNLSIQRLSNKIENITQYIKK